MGTDTWKQRLENEAREHLKKFETPLGNGYYEPASYMHLFGELYRRVEALEKKLEGADK